MRTFSDRDLLSFYRSLVVRSFARSRSHRATYIHIFALSSSWRRKCVIVNGDETLAITTAIRSIRVNDGRHSFSRVVAAAKSRYCLKKRNVFLQKYKDPKEITLRHVSLVSHTKFFFSSTIFHIILIFSQLRLFRFTKCENNKNRFSLVMWQLRMEHDVKIVSLISSTNNVAIFYPRSTFITF